MYTTGEIGTKSNLDLIVFGSAFPGNCSPTPSLNQHFCPKREVSVNVSLGVG